MKCLEHLYFHCLSVIIIHIKGIYFNYLFSYFMYFTSTRDLTHINYCSVFGLLLSKLTTRLRNQTSCSFSHRIHALFERHQLTPAHNSSTSFSDNQCSFLQQCLRLLYCCCLCGFVQVH